LETHEVVTFCAIATGPEDEAGATGVTLGCGACFGWVVTTATKAVD
jgi:hypothetical protein